MKGTVIVVIRNYLGRKYLIEGILAYLKFFLNSSEKLDRKFQQIWIV